MGGNSVFKLQAWLATPTGWLMIGLRGIATKKPLQNIKHNWGIKKSIENIFHSKKEQLLFNIICLLFTLEHHSRKS